jgi:hypothetical protein
MPLKHGQTYQFNVRADNKNVVAVIYGNNIVQLIKGEGGVFSAEVEIPANVKALSIGTANSEKGQYEFIVQYQVN